MNVTVKTSRPTPLSLRMTLVKLSLNCTALKARPSHSSERLGYRGKREPKCEPRGCSTTDSILRDEQELLRQPCFRGRGLCKADTVHMRFGGA